jgi:hypothetical protein
MACAHRLTIPPGKNVYRGMGDQDGSRDLGGNIMSSRATIIVAAGIAMLAFGATDAFAHGGGHGGGGHGGGFGGHGGFSGHFGGFHRHFFVGGEYLPYDDDYYEYDYEDCPLVRVRVLTRHGRRWRWVRSCAY